LSSLLERQLQYSAIEIRNHSLVVAGAAIVAELVLLLVILRVAPEFGVSTRWARTLPGKYSLVVARAAVVDDGAGGEESGGSHCEGWSWSFEAGVVVVVWAVGVLLVEVAGERSS
jgi:hypothetical protein